jgi:hypothetical protein
MAHGQNDTETARCITTVRTLTAAALTSGAASSMSGAAAGTTRPATSDGAWYAAVAMSAFRAATRDAGKASRSARVNALSRIRRHAAAPSKPAMLPSSTVVFARMLGSGSTCEDATARS